MSKVAVLAALALPATLCSELTHPPPQPPNEPVVEPIEVPSADRTALIEGHNALAFDLFHALRRSEAGEDQNLFLSPTSLTLALSMAYAGAAGTTAAEMEKALHFELPRPRLLAALGWLDVELGSRASEVLEVAQQSWREPPDPDDFRLHVVNALWAEQSVPFEQAFLDMLRRHHGAGLNLADFAAHPDEERLRINDWVGAETEERIRDLLPPGSVGASTKLVLANAIHLKLPWQVPFSAATDGVFKGPGGNVTAARFVSVQHEMRYLEDERMQAVAVPLLGRTMSVILILPKQGKLATLEADLTHEAFQAALSSMGEEQVRLTIPKFSFTSESLSLREALEALGMRAAFGRGADFSGMTRAVDLMIDDVHHKTMLAMDERGIEAAAATAVVVIRTSLPPPPKVMVVDRPFFIGIHDEPTGALLFLGHIVQP